MPPTQAGKSRKWCFTFFWDVETFGPRGPGKSMFDDWEIEYLYAGLEICPSTNRPHYQGYVRFENTRALNGVRKLFNPHPMGQNCLRPCKGTEAQNIKYCSKDEDLILEFGVREKSIDDGKCQGKRNDLHKVRDQVLAGACMRDVLMTATSFQSVKMAEVYLKYFERPRSEPPLVYWLYGGTGLNKTRTAIEHDSDGWISMENAQWFEGYDANHTMIIDDFRESWCPFVRLLRLLDRYPVRLPCKGGSRQFRSKVIFITSNKAPHLVYPYLGDEDIMQLGRRITTIYYMPKAGVIYGAPGVTIGIEPSVETILPERSAEQKVWGNTAEVPTTNVATQPATAAQTGLKDAKPTQPCGEQHLTTDYCIECECIEIMNG